MPLKNTDPQDHERIKFSNEFESTLTQLVVTVDQTLGFFDTIATSEGMKFRQGYTEDEIMQLHFVMGMMRDAYNAFMGVDAK